MPADDVSAENLLNMILDEVDDMIVINDSDRNVIWMNRAAQHELGISIEEAVGMRCYKLFKATCCCDKCAANRIMGGPRHCGSLFGCGDPGGEYECEPIPYYKDGKLKILVQHIRYKQK
jgi:PAS domain-containing protein